jgi:hypothetical protein
VEERKIEHHPNVLQEMWIVKSLPVWHIFVLNDRQELILTPQAVPFRESAPSYPINANVILFGCCGHATSEQFEPEPP